MRLINGIQLTSHQLLEVSTSIRNKAPCNLLVFGVGNDSQYWIQRNSGGRTVFLEDSQDWLNKVSIQVPSIEAYSVCYDTRKKDWQALLSAPGNLELILPQEIAGLRWDVILVDGPAGYRDDEPGRMKSIYSASLWAKDGCDVYVHDCDRQVERTYTDRFLSQAIMQKEVGILRHYRVPAGSR